MAKRNIIRRIVSNHLVQALLIYVSGGWIALEITDYIITNYGLNNKVRDVLSIILLIGLPIAIFLAWHLGREKEESSVIQEGKEDERKNPKFLIRFWKRRWFFLPGIVVFLLLILTGIRIIHKQKKMNWAKETALPLMEDQMHNWEYIDAFHLREQVKKFIPKDPDFQRLDTLIATKFTVITKPEGATVYYRVYEDIEDEWTILGTTPIEHMEMPNRSSFSCKIEMPGYETVYALASTWEDTLYRTLFLTEDIPDSMVYVEGINKEITGNFLSDEKQGFFMDKYEVSNREYKEFVDDGGYHNPDFWKYSFVLEDNTLSFEEAMEHFKDKTGRAGPATWEAGDYPDGQDVYPVNGVSWYEAAAYAAYAGKSLPTFDHWISAAGIPFVDYSYFGSEIIPLSNMGGSGPEKAGNNHGMSYFGIYDMAGNVREWCWNKAPAGRVVLGGAWNDVSYMATETSQLPAMNRSEKNGFRCVIIPEKTDLPEKVFRTIEPSTPRDYFTEKPVSEMEFEIMKKQFLYDYSALNSLVEMRDESATDWILEKISFDAAYENERMIAYLFLPVNANPPYQTLIYFPGSHALSINSIFQSSTTSRNLYYLLKNGRAAIIPIYIGTFERKDESCNENDPSQTHQFTECTIKWIKDLSRSIDYLESREDIDTSRIGFLGDSWGGRLGALIPAVEDRIKLNIMLRGGFREVSGYPEADEFTYVPYVKIPTLMINGRYDFDFPYETRVKSMFELLGTPADDKKLVLCDTDHYIPNSVMVKEVLDWLDTYFGIVDLKKD